MPDESSDGEPLVNRLTRKTAALIALPGVLALAACDGDMPDAGNVAARVNGQQIAIRQVAQEGAAGPGEAVFATLDALIDRELLVQKALDRRLDRDLGVQHEIDEARREILARAYVDRNMPAVDIDSLAIFDYYKAHPALFAERRLFRLDEVITPAGPGRLAEINTRIADGSTPANLADWLQQQQRAMRRVSAIRASEQIPPAALARITNLTPGQVAVFESDERISVIQLLEVRDAPLSLNEAAPIIEHALLEQKRQRFMRETARQLRVGARVEYLGMFADPKDNRQPAMTRAEAAVEPDKHLARGLAGLL